MSRKYIAIAAIAALIVLAAIGYFAWRGFGEPAAVETASPAPQSAPQTAGSAPQARIAVIDRNALMQQSKVGQDIARQIEAFAQDAKKKLTGEHDALEDEIGGFQKQADSLTPDARQKRVAVLHERQAAFQDKVQREDTRIKMGLQQANEAVSKAIAPILAQIAKEHGATLILDKSVVTMAGDSTFDVTGETVARLNEKLSSYVVTLPPSPEK